MELIPLFIALKDKLRYQRNYEVKMKTVLEYLGAKNVIAFDNVLWKKQLRNQI